MKTRKDQHQGRLTWEETKLALRMIRNPKKHFTSLEICSMTGRVSARDLVRKMQANGITIGRAKLLSTTESGTRIYGWKASK